MSNTNTKFAYPSALIIDDNEIDVLVNRRLIEFMRFSKNVIVSSTAEEALDFLKRESPSALHAPDWIFLDMHLPGMDGYAFIEEFKKLPDFIKNKTKVVILSVFNKQEHLEKILKNEFVYGQFEKPLTRDAIESLKSLVTNSVQVHHRL